jgi:hypothetical protein
MEFSFSLVCNKFFFVALNNSLYAISLYVTVWHNDSSLHKFHMITFTEKIILLIQYFPSALFKKRIIYTSHEYN